MNGLNKLERGNKYFVIQITSGGGGGGRYDTQYNDT